MNSSMGAPSRKKTKEESKDHAKEIQRYISKNSSCLIKGEKINAYYKGKFTPLDVVELPRYLLRLNPRNWRFRAEFEKIREERQRLGKPLELDPDNTEDKKTIRDLLKGKKPKNQKRIDRFNELVNDFKGQCVNGGNGQDTPGIILYDGTYVNGNRRDTILEFLQNNCPDGCQPSQFTKIRVGILESDVTESDIKANETREQIGLDSRERYDYTNSALMVLDYVNHLTKIEKLSKDQALEQISKQVFGLDKKQINEYLEFSEMADEFLNVIGKKGEYDYIQDVGKDADEGGIVTILREMKGQKKKILDMKLSPTKTGKLIKSLHMFTWLSKEKPKIRNRTGKLKPMNYNQRSWRIFKNQCFDSVPAMDKLLESGSVSKINWKKPQEIALDFNSDIERSKNVTDTRNAEAQPIVLLEKATSSLTELKKSLTGMQGKAVKRQILDKKGKTPLLEIQKTVQEIIKKLKT